LKDVEGELTLSERALLDLALGPLEVLERMQVPAMVMRLHEEGEGASICFVNDAAVAFLGYEREELLGRGPEFWQSYDRDIADLKKTEVALRAGETVTLDTRARAKDGTALDVEVKMSPHAGPWGTWVVGTAIPRTRAMAVGARGPQSSSVRSGAVVLDPGSRWLWVGEERVQLTPSESVVLEMLMAKAECVVERSTLYGVLWGFDPSKRSRAIDVYVGSLRRKLAELGAPDAIHTVRGVGYLFHGPDAAAT
jgi:PAS domain S-box-containing protein